MEVVFSKLFTRVPCEGRDNRTFAIIIACRKVRGMRKTPGGSAVGACIVESGFGIFHKMMMGCIVISMDVICAGVSRPTPSNLIHGCYCTWTGQGRQMRVGEQENGVAQRIVREVD
jgi:hypothetical protein